MISSCIVTADDLEFAKDDVIKKIDSKLIKTFFVDEFKVEDAKEVISEAYIAEERSKYLIICAKNFNIYAQNSLLKLLEEPPRNIIFIIIAKSKNSLLPTIRSRMSVKHLKSDKEPYDLGIGLENLSLNDIFAFLKKSKNISKDELKEIVSTLLKELSKTDIKLSSSELDMFDKAMELSQLNSRPQNILSYLLLMIYQAKGRKS